ncbi:MAG: erythromycin esterase family protein, partial [Nocardia sp.]|nr:erythromycin esterase family protein [Nocardia sp.]
MSTVGTLRDLGDRIDDPVSLARAVDRLLAARTEPPELFGLGEPTHGFEAFPLLRNELLGHLVERGYRSIALETDFFAAAMVEDYVSGAATDIDSVLETGFSHRFGAVPGNRELLQWLRAHNAGREPRERTRFYGFDAPVEYAGGPSPRHALTWVLDYLPPALRPPSAREILASAGDDAEWTNEAAMYDPAASIGNSHRARALRVLADDLASVLRRAAPMLRPADASAYDLAVAHARTALGLSRYHAGMADPVGDRMSNLLSLRAEMMADNLLAIRARERHRGPTLAFAHNVHLQRTRSDMTIGPDTTNWCGAGALVAEPLRDRYVFVAADAAHDSAPGTLQHML